MNTSRATLVLSAIILATVLSFSNSRAPGDEAFADPSVPPASIALANAGPASEGNVQDLTY